MISHRSSGPSEDSHVFSDLLLTIELDVAQYETKANLIDEGLVRRRHKIAHGERLEIELATFAELRREVLWCLETLRNQIENAAVEKRFMKATPAGA